MAKLTDLGFSKGIIFEVIPSTYNPDGAPTAAPMGATMQNQQTVNLNIFNSSQTSRNLTTNRCAVINLTSNIEVYYKTAFKDANPEGKLPQEWFEKAEVVIAPKLRLADATIEVSVVNMESVGVEKTKFICNVEKVNVVKVFPQVYCRAMPATLEAIVHATRVKVFVKDEKKKEQVNQLLQTIHNCRDVVNRTAPNSVYSAVMADLMIRIDSWRNKP
jgi:hypothetical protein